MAQNIVFSPAVPIPLVFDVQANIQRMRRYLDPSDPLFQRVEQHQNILAAIKLLENREIDGSERVHIMDGKITTNEEISRSKGWVWAVVRWVENWPTRNANYLIIGEVVSIMENILSLFVMILGLVEHWRETFVG